METITGIITRVLWRDEAKGGLLALVRYEGPTGLVDAKISARAPELGEGDFFVASGAWQEKSYKGRTEEIFSARTAHPDLPTTKAGAAKWFSTIFDASRHGVTPESVKAFVERHGANVALTCEREPERLAQISSSPSTYRAAILQEWGRRVSGRRAVKLMESSGVGRAAIAAVLEAFKDGAFKVLNEDPYRTARIKQVGFGNADLIGNKIGIETTDSRRVGAALVATLEEVRSEGHTYADLAGLGARMEDAFGIGLPTAADHIRANMEAKDAPVRVERYAETFVAQLAVLAEGEKGIADDTVKMLATGRRRTPAEVSRAVDPLFAQEKYARFDEVQRAGVRMAVAEPFCILTGGPGTGKSTLVEVVLAASKAAGVRTILACAPTGKAAKRINEATGEKAVTIHSLLGAKEDKAQGGTTFSRGPDKPLPAGCLVLVDEASMVDVPTMRALLAAMPPDGRLVLVGDRNQLPSVDAGSVLSDLIEAKGASGERLVPCTELVNVYRQSRDSRIATGAAEIREGNLPFLSNKFDGGVVLYEHEPSEILERVKWIVQTALIGKLGYKPHQIAVLTPQNPSTAGAWQLNRMLSTLLNPKGAPIPGVSRTPGEESEQPVPRLGDRVMLTENEAELGVMNGDIGTIVKAFPRKTPSGGERNFITVRFDSGDEVDFPAAQWRKFVLAYAITIHKSQGSQYQAVVMPVTSAHEGMLDRSLLYTGWTRAKNLLFVVGDREALQKSVERTDMSRRDTRLREFVARAARMRGYRQGTVPDDARRPSPAASAPPARPGTAATPVPPSAGTSSGVPRPGMRPSFLRPVRSPPAPADPVLPPSGPGR